jgi:hypothetical protein
MTNISNEKTMPMLVNQSSIQNPLRNQRFISDICENHPGRFGRLVPLGVTEMMGSSTRQSKAAPYLVTHSRVSQMPQSARRFRRFMRVKINR